ncbi:MAG: IDEAL domain-containing protein [Bacillus sp. (in: firmicutes)]
MEKSTAMQKRLGTETFMLKLYVDMMLQEALLKTEKDKILKKIDEALDQRNEEMFHRYCAKLQEITKQFGT